MTRLIRLDKVRSTQDAAHRLAEAGEPDGTAVVAREQTAGRGSRGQRWESPLGGLWLSVLRRPTEAAPPLVLSLSAGVAVALVLESAGVPGVSVKWPNDLMVEDAKIGGILCEVRWHGELPAWAVIGVGINVTAPPPGRVSGATFVTAHTSAVSAPDELVDPIIDAVRSLRLELSELNSHSFAELIRRDWLRGATLLDPIPGGVCSGVDRTGALVVRDPDGAVRELRSGPVTVDSTIARAPVGGGRLTSEPDHP